MFPYPISFNPLQTTPDLNWCEVLFNRDQIFDFAELPLFDSLHFHDIFDFLVGPTINNSLGFHRPNSRESIKLLFARRINVYLLPGCELRGWSEEIF